MNPAMCNVITLPNRAEAKLIRSQAMHAQRIASASTPDEAFAAVLGELRAVFANAGDEDKALMAAHLKQAAGEVCTAQRRRAGTKARGRGRVRAA